MRYSFEVGKLAMLVDFVLIGGMSLLGLIVVFLVKSKNALPKKLLIVFFLSSMFFLLYYYAFLHKSRALAAIAVLFGNGSGYLLGPFLLYYLKSLVVPKAYVLRGLLRHLIPFFIAWLAISIPLSIHIGTGNLSRYGAILAQNADYLNLIENAFFMGYMIITLAMLRRIRGLFRQQYSHMDRLNLQWFNYLVIGLAFIILLDSLFSLYELYFPVVPWNIGTIIAFLFVGLYSFLGYKGMFQANILLPDFLVHQEFGSSGGHNPSEDERSKASRSVRQLDPVSSEQIEQLKTRVHDLLENERLYLDKSLNLTDLAAAMEISNKKLSELLNQHLNTSFYNLINEYRVNEVKRKLASPESEKYTLLGIANDAGFQSKASFNRVFKEKTGMSPSRYRKSRVSPTKNKD